MNNYWNINRDLREAHVKSLNEMEDLKRFQVSTFYEFFEEKINRRSRHYPWTHSPKFRNYRMKLIVWMIREILKMLNRYEVDNPSLPENQAFFHLFQILAECWAVLGECWAAMISRQIFGIRMVYRETFLQIQRRLLQHFIRKSRILGVLMYQYTHHHMWWVKAKHQFRIWDASLDRQPEIHSSPVRGRFSKNCGCRPTTTADFQILIWQIPHVSNVRLLEGKFQDWGMYLFKISSGSYTLDQRSGDGWFSGWFKIFVINERYFNARFWSTRCEDCFSTEQNHP